MTNTTERGFELPFAQLLNSLGHTIIHIDSHSPHEQGKDIVTLDSRSRPCGFQLKQGDIDGKRWDREIHPEVSQLAELPAWHDPVKDRLLAPHLVTTGTLTNAAHHRLRQFNTSLQNRGFMRVTLHDKHWLQRRFTNAFGKFVPLQLENSTRLLQFFLKDGSENLDKEDFYHLISSFRRFKKNERGHRRRHISGLPILGSYALAPAAQQNNHLALAEGMILVGARILALATEYRIDESDWQSSFELCRDAALTHLRDLADETTSSYSLHSGSVLGDGGLIWRARVTVLMGCIAASRLADRAAGILDASRDDAAFNFIEQHAGHFIYWGESSAAHVWMIYWFMRRHARWTLRAENFLGKYIYTIGITNGSQGTGLAPPHDSVDKCLQRYYSHDLEDQTPFTTFEGKAYTVRPMALELARCLRRQLLNSLWPQASAVFHAHLVFNHSKDVFAFEVKKGREHSQPLDCPASWRALRSEAKKYADESRKRLPRLLIANPSFAVLFAIVHPHRLDHMLTAYLSQVLRQY